VSVIAVALLLVVAGFLVVSAVAKAIHPNAATAALLELGVSQGLARSGVAGAVVLEAATASAFVMWPRTFNAQLACIALFGGFALVGAVAIGSGRKVECGCFGSLHRTTLGWTQILQFALLAPSVILVGRYIPEWTDQMGLAVLTCVLVGVSSVLVVRVLRPWWQISRDRISLGSVEQYALRTRSAQAHMVEDAAKPT
jgi:hypothetical protein